MYTDPSPEAIEQTRQLLTTLEPGKLPLSLFNEVARLTVTPVVEVVPLSRKPTGSITVWLGKRPDDDPNWPGMLYVPGTIVLPTDTKDDFSDATERVLTAKLASVQATRPVFVQNMFCKAKRGAEAALVYYTEIADGSAFGHPYDTQDLPKTLIEGHAQFIQAAVTKFSGTP